MFHHKKKVFSILLSVFAITVFIFILTGCKNKNIKLRDEAISKAQALVADKIEYAENIKSADDGFEGIDYISAPQAKKQEIKDAIASLKAIDASKLTEEDVNKLENLIKGLSIIKGSAMKVEFDPQGATADKPLVVKVKKGQTLTNEQIPNLTKEGFALDGWQVDGKDIDKILEYKIEKHTKFVAQFVVETKYKVEIAEDSKTYVTLDNKGGAIDFNAVKVGTEISFTIANIPVDKVVKKITFDNNEVIYTDDNKLAGKFTPTTNGMVQVELENKLLKLNYTGEGLVNDKTFQNGDSILYGTKLVFSFKEKVEHYAELRVNGTLIDLATLEKVGDTYKYQLVMDKDQTLTLTYVAIPKYNVEYSGENVTADVASNTQVLKGTKVKFSITKKAHYQLKFEINDINKTAELVDKGVNFEFEAVVEAPISAKTTFTEDPKHNIKYSMDPTFASGTHVGSLTADVANDSNVYVNTKVIFTIKKVMKHTPKLTINDQEITSANLVDAGTDFTYEVVVSGPVVAHLTYTKNTKNYKLEIQEGLARIQYDTIKFSDLNNIEENERFRFTIKNPNPEEIVEVDVDGVKLTPVTGETHTYEFELNSNKVLKVKFSFKKYAVSFNDGITVNNGGTNVVSGETFVKGTRLVLTYEDKVNKLAQIAATGDYTKVSHTLSGTTYTLTIDVAGQVEFRLTYVNARILNVTDAVKDKLELVDAVKDPETNKIAFEEGTPFTLKFKINIPEGKFIKKLTYNGENIPASESSDFIYQKPFNADTTIDFEFDDIKYDITPSFNPDNSKDYVKISSGTYTNIQAGQKLIYNSKVRIETVGALPANSELSVSVNGVKQTLPYEFNILQDTTIEVIVEKVSATLKFEFKDKQKMFEAGCFGTNIHDYANKNQFFTQTHTINKGYLLPENKKAMFIDTKETGFVGGSASSIHLIFDGFRIKGTNIRVNFGDRIPLIQDEIILEPVFKEGLYRTDLTLNVYFLYEAISPSEMRLIEVGNIRNNGSEEYTKIPDGRELRISNHEIVEYGDGKRVTYDIISIGDNATKHLKNAEVINIYDTDNNNIREIGDNNFNNIVGLKRINIGPKINYVGLNCFNGNNELAIDELNGVKYLGGNNNEFHKYLIAIGLTDPNATEITLHENTRVIASGAFKNSAHLTKVVLNSSIRSIGKEAFMGCTKLETINLNVCINLGVVGSKAFNGSKIVKANLDTIPNKKCMIANDAI